MEVTREVKIDNSSIIVKVSGNLINKQTMVTWVPETDPRFGRFMITNLTEVVMAKARKVKVRLFKKAKGRTLYIGKTVRKDKDSSFRLTHQKSGRVISYESMTRAKKDGWVEVK